jgi:hypothetical protein
MVLRLNADCHYDPAIFTSRGIAHADLRDAPAPGGGSGGEWRLSLGELDRFVRHMDTAPGLVALHFACDDAHTHALVGSYIARRMHVGASAPASPASPAARRRRAAAAAAAAAGGGADGSDAREAVAWLHIAHPYPGGGWQRVATDADSDHDAEPGDPAAAAATAAAATAVESVTTDVGKLADAQDGPVPAALTGRA